MLWCSQDANSQRWLGSDASLAQPESDASLAQCDSPRPATRIIAKLRILDSDALCTTIWVKLSLGSRTASGLARIDALLEQSG